MLNEQLLRPVLMLFFTESSKSPSIGLFHQMSSEISIQGLIFDDF